MIATTATAAAGLADRVVTISRHLVRARRRREPRRIRCLSQEYRMSPLLRPSHRRHPADLGAAVASSEAAASAGAAASAKDTALVEVDSGTAAASPEDMASVEVDSAALMGALATARNEFAPSVPSNRFGLRRIRTARDHTLMTTIEDCVI